jgi:hypothetical protein
MDYIDGNLFLCHFRKCGTSGSAAQSGHLRKCDQPSGAIMSNKVNDGRRLVASGGGTIYLVMDGFLRAIPNKETYDKIFADEKGIENNDFLISTIPIGEPISNGSLLTTAETNKAIFLITNGKKQYVRTGDILAKFNFMPHSKTTDDVILGFVPSGDDVS